jgi:protein-tyrosine-phosphatase
MPSILFVCTANRFRSPLAAAWFQKHLGGQADARDWSVGSAGTWAEPGQAVVPSAKWMAEHFGLDLGAHRAQRVSGELLAQYDLILVMENSHRESLLVEFPELEGRVLLLAQVAAGQAYDVPDPGVVPDETFLDIAKEVTTLIDQGFEKICRLARPTANL